VSTDQPAQRAAASVDADPSDYLQITVPFTTGMDGGAYAAALEAWHQLTYDEQRSFDPEVWFRGFMAGWDDAALAED
jgi:hypothetical protein